MILINKRHVPLDYVFENEWSPVQKRGYHTNLPSNIYNIQHSHFKTLHK